MSRPVLILDFGSQTTELIARRIREAHVYCELIPFTTALAAIRERDPVALVLSGGPASVYEEDAPQVDKELFELGIPVLGICYGMQLMASLLGGHVAKSESKEFGRASAHILSRQGIFARFETHEDVQFWMSHGDRVDRLPKDFEILASSEHAPIAAMADCQRRLYGVQFHPEVVHSPRGADVLHAFLFDVAGAPADFTPSNFVKTSIDGITAAIGDGHAICGLSGGVDSSVAAVLVSRAIGSKLTCIFVDNGLLRKNEADRVLDMFRGRLDLRIVHVDAADEFLSALAGVSDPEQKRKIIGKVFIDVFDREAQKIDNVTHLVQGTLYPDVIESVSHKGPSAVIKSHHNVGGLPDRMKLKLCEPLRTLFKDEVREVGASLDMPRDVLWRHPFPGPGLAVRVLGDITPDKLEIVREADAILEEEIRAAGEYDKIWQCFCVLLPVYTVGVMGDGRTYERVIALRAVSSQDGMTADWSRIPYDVLARVSTRIINEVRGCNRVVYDISSKPPATIEWE